MRVRLLVIREAPRMDVDSFRLWMAIHFGSDIRMYCVLLFVSGRVVEGGKDLSLISRHWNSVAARIPKGPATGRDEKHEMNRNEEPKNIRGRR